MGQRKKRRHETREAKDKKPKGPRNVGHDSRPLFLPLGPGCAALSAVVLGAQLQKLRQQEETAETVEGGSAGLRGGNSILGAQLQKLTSRDRGEEGGNYA